MTCIVPLSPDSMQEFVSLSGHSNHHIIDSIFGLNSSREEI